MIFWWDYLLICKSADYLPVAKSRLMNTVSEFAPSGWPGRDENKSWVIVNSISFQTIHIKRNSEKWIILLNKIEIQWLKSGFPARPQHRRTVTDGRPVIQKLLYLALSTKIVKKVGKTLIIITIMVSNKLFCISRRKSSYNLSLGRWNFSFDIPSLATQSVLSSQ